LKKLKIYLDFDGTVVEHQFPGIGRYNFGCIEVIKKLQVAGHEIILNTYRADIEGEYLNEALRWINEDYLKLLTNPQEAENFKLDPITKFTKKKIHPSSLDFEVAEQTGELFIDDISANTPLMDAVMSQTRMVDWAEMDLIFRENGVY